MSELKRPSQAEVDAMSHADKDALILVLFDMLGRHEQYLKDLKSKVEKTSRISSKPPSSDGLKKGPAEPHRKGEKPVGGVSGHSGATREMGDHPDRIEERPHPSFCLGNQRAQRDQSLRNPQAGV